MAVSTDKGTVGVLGGTGFVGRTLAAKLVRAGFAVRIPTRNRQRARKLLVLPGLELVQADVHDADQLARVISGCDAVINLIGILNERGHDGSGFRRVHVELVEKLMAACRRLGVKRLIQMSALKANAERGPSHYLTTKGQAEQIVQRQAGDSIHYTIFRPSVIFGPEDTFTNRFAGILRLSPILPLARLEARFAPVYVRDVAEAFVRALTDSRSFGKTYELCGPDIYTLEEILRYLCRELGIRRAIVGLPGPLGRLQAWIGEYLLPGKPFSRDNYRSLAVASVCRENGFAAFGIEPKRMHAIVGSYLAGSVDELAAIRQQSRH
ncbi:MAG TPA: complex I NDUFA9 subunit family protein [Gammaproteobacteria bacterium]|nr:complex I NDUFA9 subunit family protein [Gammaproteobacteria bacterium]